MSRRPRNASHDNASTTSSLGSYSRSRSPGSRTSSTRRIPPPLERAQSIKDKTAHFFGIPSGEGNDSANLSSNAKWQRKRLRHLQKEYGLKPEAIQSVAAAVTPVVEYDVLGDIVNNLPPPDTTPSSSLPRSDSDGSRIYSRILSMEAPQMERKESVMRMAVEACESIVRGEPFRRSRKFPANRSPGNSFSIRRNQSTLTANSSFPIRPPIIMQALPEVSTDAETSFSEPSRDPDRPFVGTPIQSDEEIRDFDNRPRFGIRPEGRQQAFIFPGRRQQVTATRGRSRSSPLVHQLKVEESEDELPPKPREESRVKFADVKTREMDDERSDNEQQSTSGTTTTSALRPKELLIPFLNKSQQQESRRGVQFVEPPAMSSRGRSKMDTGENVSFF
uniref:Uncharacterized protein n=1 Tax=Panagrolaimus superbus TaxID=310955 RepID=A0A914Y4F4_9BILA